MKSKWDTEEIRKPGPMSSKEKKIIGTILVYFVLVAALVIYVFFFSGVLL